MVDAVVFDLDGVLLDSEQVWDEIRRSYVQAQGGHWEDEATRAMMGMSAPEWSRFLHEELGVPASPDVINADVVEAVQARYGESLPLLPGAREVVERLAARWPLGLASSSNRAIIDTVLEAARLAPLFSTTVSSEEVPRGKPAPDVYLEASRRLGVEPAAAVAIEDSTNGLRSAIAAGHRVVAVPNPHFPPEPATLALADMVGTLDAITIETIEALN